MQRPPSCPAGLKLFQVIVSTERKNRLENLARLQELAGDPSVSIFCAHDQHEFDQLKAGSA
jgi:hypothetical protein